MKARGRRPSAFIVFECLKPRLNTKYEFEITSLTKENSFKLSFEYVFSIQLLYLRREICISKKCV